MMAYNVECALGQCAQATMEFRYFTFRLRRKTRRRKLCYTCYLEMVLSGADLPPWEDGERHVDRRCETI